MKINLKFLRVVLKTWKEWLPDKHKKIGEELNDQVLQCPIKRLSLVEKLISIREHLAGLIITTRRGVPYKWLVSLISHFINKLQSPPPTS